MSKKYEKLDAEIIHAISEGCRAPAYQRGVSSEAFRLANDLGIPRDRVLDRRMQALRKKGVIRYLTKSASPVGAAGWHLAE